MKSFTYQNLRFILLGLSLLVFSACNTKGGDTGGATCGIDAHCPDGYICQTGQCVPGFFGGGPDLSIVSPEQGSLVGGILSIAVQAKDPTDVQTDTVVAVIGNVETSLTGDDNGNYTGNVDTASIEQVSDQILVVKALDPEGNTGMARTEFTLDLIGPDIIIAVPTIESDTSFTFTTYVTDASGVDITSVEGQLGDSEAFSLSETGSGLYTTTVDISSLSESGVYTLVISATDIYGNSSSASRVVDLIGPTIEITEPLAGALVGGNISISATVTDNSDVDESSVSAAIGDVEGLSLTSNGDNTFTGTFSDTDSLGGVEAQNLSVTATDVYGNTKTETIALTIDFVAPTITWVEPLSNTVVTDETFILATTVTDNASIASVSVDVGNQTGVALSNTSDDRYEVTLTTEEVSLEGLVTATITATDIYGNESQLNQDISIDRSGPTITINNPTSGEYIGPQFQINVDAADLSGVASVVATVDSTLEYTLSRQGTSDTFVIDFETQHLISTGVIDWQILATDTLGNQTLLASTFIEDLEKPVIALTSPEASLVGGSIIISATFTDNVAINTDTIEASLSTADNLYPLTLELYTGSEYRTTFDIASELAVNNDLANEMVLTLSVKDLADSNDLTVANSTTVYFQLNIDKEAPAIAIMEPATDEVVTGTFSIVVAATDNSDQIASVIATIDSNDDGSETHDPITLIDYGSTYEATFNANLIVEVTTPELKITATDIYGNTSSCCSESPHYILVNADGPNITITAPTSESATVTSDLAIEAQVTDDEEDKGLLMLCSNIINESNCYEYGSFAEAPANCQTQCVDDGDCGGANTCDALVMGFVTATGASCSDDSDCSGVATCNDSSICEATIQTHLNLKSGETDIFEGTFESTDFIDLGIPGEQTLIIKAYDADYNPSTATQAFSTDNVAPTVSVVVPEVNSYISPSAVNVLVTATDLQGVCSLTAQVDSGSVIDLWQHGEKGCSSLPGNVADCSSYAPEATNSNYFCRQVSVSNVSSPPNVLTVKAKDAFNNETTFSWPVTVDVTGPVIALDSLDISTSGDNAGELTIEATLTDEGHTVSGANFVIFDTVCNEAEGTTCQQSWVIPLANSTGDTWIFDETDENVPFFTSVLATSGSVAFEIQATDSQGNDSSVQGAFPVDNVGPTLTVMSPVADTYLNGVIDVKLSVLDTAGVDSVTVKFSDTAGGADPDAGADCIIPPDQTGSCNVHADCLGWTGDACDDSGNPCASGSCVDGFCDSEGSSTYQTCEFVTCDENSDCSSGDCALDCDPDNGDADCASGGTCGVGCTEDSDCGTGGTCDTQTNTCDVGVCTLGECTAASKQCAPFEEPCSMVFFGGSTYGLQGGYDLSSKLSASTDLTVVTFEATDSLGNSTIALSQVNLDRAGPEISITYPGAYDLVQGPIIVEATVSEQSCISLEDDAVTLLVAGGNAPGNSILVNELSMNTHSTDCLSRNYFIEIDTNDLVGMVFPSLNITAKDIYGNVSQGGHAFALDNRGPLPGLDEHYLREMQYVNDLPLGTGCAVVEDCPFPAYQKCTLPACAIDDDCATGTCVDSLCTAGGACEMCTESDNGCVALTAQGLEECSMPFNPLGESAVRHGDFYKGLDEGSERNFSGTFVVRARVEDRGNDVGDIATAYMQAGLDEESVKLYMLRVYDEANARIAKDDGSGDISLLKNQHDYSHPTDCSANGDADCPSGISCDGDTNNCDIRCDGIDPYVYDASTSIDKRALVYDMVPATPSGSANYNYIEEDMNAYVGSLDNGSIVGDNDPDYGAVDEVRGQVENVITEGGPGDWPGDSCAVEGVAVITSEVEGSAYPEAPGPLCSPTVPAAAEDITLFPSLSANPGVAMVYVMTEFGAPSNPITCAGGAYDWLNNLEDGIYCMAVEATDGLGNKGASKPIVFCVDGDQSGNCEAAPFNSGADADTIRDQHCIPTGGCVVQETYSFLGGVISP